MLLGHFRPEVTEPTEFGWKITVPFENKLAESKASLKELVGPVRDGLVELEEYWKLNSLIIDSSAIIYVLDEHDVNAQEVVMPRTFFDRMRHTKELASKCQGKVEIMFSGYDNDSRELFEIVEVREYVAKLDSALPDLFFFARTEQPTYTLMTFALCQTDVEWIDDRSTNNITKKVTFDSRPVAMFIKRHCPALNQLTEWIGMSLDEEKRLFFAIVKCLGVRTPSNTDET